MEISIESLSLSPRDRLLSPAQRRELNTSFRDYAVHGRRPDGRTTIRAAAQRNVGEQRRATITGDRYQAKISRFIARKTFLLFARDSFSGTIIERHIYFFGDSQRRRRRWSCRRTCRSFTRTAPSSRCNREVNRFFLAIKQCQLVINSQNEKFNKNILLSFLFLASQFFFFKWKIEL